MKRIFLAAGALAALVGCGRHAAPASAAADTSAVLANVNGTHITQAQIEAAIHSLVEDPAQAKAFLTSEAAAPQRAQLVHQLAFQAAMDQVAAQEHLDQDPAVQFKLAQARASIYADALASREAGAVQPTDQELQAFYEAIVAQRKAAGQDQGLPPFSAFQSNAQMKAQLAQAWRQDHFKKAAEAFDERLRTRVPVTYAEGMQTPVATY